MLMTRRSALTGAFAAAASPALARVTPIPWEKTLPPMASALVEFGAWQRYFFVGTNGIYTIESGGLRLLMPPYERSSHALPEDDEG